MSSAAASVSGMNEDDLTRCGTCYAYVKLSSRHRTWHAEQDRKIQQLEATVRRLEQKMR